MASRRNTPKAASNPALGNHPVLSYVSPDIRDLLIYKRVDSKLGTYKEPAYGSAYPSKDDEYPNHKLVYVTSADANGKVKWYYAADREEQGAYNFSHVHPSGSQGGYPYYIRTYVVRREDVDHYFDGTGEASMHVVTTGSAVLSAIDEVFSVTGEQDGAPSYTSPSGYTLKKNGNTWNLVIGVLSAFDGVNGLQDVATPDLVTGWISMNDFSPQTVDITALPASGSEYLDAGAEDPDISFNPEFEGYQFTSLRIVRINDKELDSCYVLVERKFEKLCPRTGKRINPITGDLEDYTERVVLNEDATGSPVNSDGIGTSVTPLNCEFSLERTESIRPFESYGYTTNMNYYWPPVLDYIETQVWDVNGSDVYLPVVHYKEQAYNGPCKAYIQVSWSKDPPAVIEPQIMLPITIFYASPFYKVNTGPCLHEYYRLWADLGNNINTSQYYDKTNFSVWPESLVASSQTVASRGGYVTTTTIVYAPRIHEESSLPDPPTGPIDPESVNQWLTLVPEGTDTPPSGSHTPLVIEVTPGSSFEAAGAASRPDSLYIWRYDEDPQQALPVGVSQRNNKLIITNFDPSMAGVYRLSAQAPLDTDPLTYTTVFMSFELVSSPVVAPDDDEGTYYQAWNSNPVESSRFTMDAVPLRNIDDVTYAWYFQETSSSSTPSDGSFTGGVISSEKSLRLPDAEIPSGKHWWLKLVVSSASENVNEVHKYELTQADALMGLSEHTPVTASAGGTVVFPEPPNKIADKVFGSNSRTTYTLDVKSPAQSIDGTDYGGTWERIGTPSSMFESQLDFSVPEFTTSNADIFHPWNGKVRVTTVIPPRAVYYEKTGYGAYKVEGNPSVGMTLSAEMYDLTITRDVSMTLSINATEYRFDSVLASGWSEIEWFKDGNSLSSGLDDFYIIDPASPSDNGDYYYVAKYSDGSSVQSNTITVNV